MGRFLFISACRHVHARLVLIFEPPNLLSKYCTSHSVLLQQSLQKQTWISVLPSPVPFLSRISWLFVSGVSIPGRCPQVFICTSVPFLSDAACGGHTAQFQQQGCVH